MTGHPRPTPAGGSPLEVLGVALRLGLTSFGGPIAHIGYFRREYVARRRWLDEHAFAELVALCQALPGPASSQLGIAIGTRRAGRVGGLAAWLGFTLPSAVALVVFALLTGGVDLSRAGWVAGLKLAAVAVVAQAVWSMARRLTPDLPRLVVAGVAAAVTVVWASPASQVALIAFGALVGRLLLAPPAAPIAPDGGGGRAIGRRAALASLAGFAVLLVGLALLRVVVAWQPLALFETFYRAGSLVFGGGHVVLPLLHASVVDPGWVSDDRFLAGYGAAQAVPGPLFTFSAYLGAVSSVPPAGWLGAGIALVGIFLPSFLLVFGVLPFWESLRRSESVRRALAGTNAAVVGILLAALYDPVATAAIHSPADVALALGALALLVVAKAPPIVVVLLVALAGQLVGG